MRKSNRLTAKEVERAKPGVHQDGGGLLLRVETTGSKRWVLRITVKGRRRDFGLGSAHDVSLREVRDQAHDLRKDVRQDVRLGRDPIAQRRENRQGTLSFEAAAEKVHQQRLKAWGNAKHSAQWITTLRTYAFPVIGKMPVGDVQSADVERVLLPIWLTKPETARRVRQRVGTVLTWASVVGHRSPSLVNAAHAVGPILPKQPRRDKHHAAVPWQEIPRFVMAARASESGASVGLALEFLMLTAARTGEVIGAQWVEIDFETASWTIPATRMKSKREHRIPLSKPALHILLDCRARWPQSTYVFPGRHGGKLSNMALLMLMRRLERKEVPHGLRSSFRDWAADNRWDRDLAEAALAHVVKGRAEAAYLRTDLHEARRSLMDAWAEFASPATTVDRAVELTA